MRLLSTYFFSYFSFLMLFLFFFVFHSIPQSICRVHLLQKKKKKENNETHSFRYAIAIVIVFISVYFFIFWLHKKCSLAIAKYHFNAFDWVLCNLVDVVFDAILFIFWKFFLVLEMLLFLRFFLLARATNLNNENAHRKRCNSLTNQPNWYSTILYAMKVSTVKENESPYGTSKTRSDIEMRKWLGIEKKKKERIFYENPCRLTILMICAVYLWNSFKKNAFFSSFRKAIFFFSNAKKHQSPWAVSHKRWNIITFTDSKSNP